MKFLLVHNIQTKKQWHKDSLCIANNVYKQLGYKLPNETYYNNFIMFLVNFIQKTSIYLYDIEDIKDMLYTIAQESFDNAISSNENLEYFEFDTSSEEIVKMSNLLLSQITNYYKDSTIIKQLVMLPKDTILVYSLTFSKNMLSGFYQHNNPIFKATSDDDNKIMEELYILYGTDIEVLK